MKNKAYLFVFATTLLLSAALLFAVQPLFSKMILPLLGGSAQVWNTAMVFFQVMLLAGYAYAHGTTRWLSVRKQALLHIALLCLFVFMLPIAVPTGWTPPVYKDPTVWQLTLMLTVLGGPFFVIAGSAPMFQRWFTVTGHPDADNPYFLYGASNFGSMAALLSYPILIEPALNLDAQSAGWTFGYVLLIMLSATCAWLVWPQASAPPNKIEKDDKTPVTWRQRLHWIALAAVPSSLMLGVTTYITTDVASAPLLWILPLALYVGSFIIVFARKRLLSDRFLLYGCFFLLCFLVFQSAATGVPILFVAGFHLTLFFFLALACHTVLASSKPDAKNLTEFYLLMALGGAIGGMFNTLVAPIIFVTAYEYALALAAALVLCLFGLEQKKDSSFLIESGGAMAAALFLFLTSKHHGNEHVRDIYSLFLLISLLLTISNKSIFTAAICFCLLLSPPGSSFSFGTSSKVIRQDRNFFGILKVVEDGSKSRALMNGTTLHGLQNMDKKYRTTPASYYGPHSPIADIFSILDKEKRHQEIGVLGLGAGVIACFDKEDRHFDFFEINPMVVKIAETLKDFTYLSECNSPYSIIMGDGRLKIAEQPNDHYDLIIMDAFNSDNIPVHVITLEALNLYMEKIHEDGVLAVHVSNRNLDLEPVLAVAAEKMGVYALGIMSEPEKDEDKPFVFFSSHYVVLTKNKSYVDQLKAKGWSEARKRKGVKLWTDQYSNIVSVIGYRIGRERSNEIHKDKLDTASPGDKVSAP